MVTEALTARKNTFEGNEKDAHESFINHHFWLHFPRWELTFEGIQFTGYNAKCVKLPSVFKKSNRGSCVCCAGPDMELMKGARRASG